ncbi:hypothetical protein [Rhizobium sp. BK181]
MHDHAGEISIAASNFHQAAVARDNFES